MIAYLRQRFDRTSLREKVLLNAFLWVMLILWIDSTISELRITVEQWRANQATLETFDQRLAQKPMIEAALEEMEARFDKGRTRDGTELTGHIAQLLRRSGLNPRNFNVDTQPGDVFDWHEMRLSVADAQLMPILRFEQAIRSEAPYINVERILLRGNSGNEAYISANFDINSFELKSTRSSL